MKRLTTSEFITKAKARHGNRYLYDKCVYVTAKIPITIKCKNCDQDFVQTPDSHLQGKGCSICGGSLPHTKESFINKAKTLFIDKIDYSKVIFINTHTKVELLCLKCGCNFQKSPTHHLSGQGCPACMKKEKTQFTSFTRKANAIFNGTYDYSMSICSNNREKVLIWCNIHNSYFSKTPANHLKGQGCPHCSSSGFKENKPAILYYIRVDGMYKIGITNRSVSLRFSASDLARITIIQTWDYASGKEARMAEQEIIRQFNSSKYVGDKILRDGNTEIFKYDILGLDL